MPHTRGRTHRPGGVRPLLLAVVLMAMTVVAACSSGSDDGDAASSGTTTSTEAASQDGDTEGTDPLPALPEDVALPIVFVHGFAGSAQQYESQAMRFVANGYPQERIIAYDHDGAGLDIDAYVAGVTEVVDEALATFDVEQVYLVGHSRGTRVSSTYLERSRPRRPRSPSTSPSTASPVPTWSPASRRPRRPSRASRTSRWPPRRSPSPCSTSSSSARRPRSSTSCPSAIRSRSRGGR